MAEIEYIEINPVTRKIITPSDMLLGVMEDRDVERRYFKCPKIVGDNIDLSQHQIYIKYTQAIDNSGRKFSTNPPGIYHCDDVMDGGDYITFSWKLSGNVFLKEGFMAFSVLASDGEVTRWNTVPAIGTVLITIPGGLEEVAELYPDIITQLFDKINEIESGSIDPEKIQSAVSDYMSANPIDVPKNLSDLQEDSAHRTVTDEEKDKWNKSEENVQPDWNESDSTKDSYIQNKPVALKNPKKLTFTGAVTAEYDGSGAVTVTIPESSGGSGGTVRIEKLSTDTAVELEANKLYIFPEMSELTITLAEPDASVASEYHFVFQSGATATTLTIPDTVKIPSGFTVDASKIYEVSILEGCLCAQSWAVS